jgi:hypothetical protein
MALTVTTGTLPLALAETLSSAPAKVYIYMEYANSSGAVPTSFTTASNITNFSDPLGYYSNLDSTKNFLRVSAIRNPNIANSVGANSGAATTVYIAQTDASTQGVLSGNAAVSTGSICYGAALVLALDDNDRTRDIVMARSYFVGSTERLIKSAASELFITFPLTINSTRAT